MFEHLVERYGYLGLFVGTFLEGETILVIAGVMAHRGVLSLPGVVLAAFLGSYSGDQLFFWIGHTYGHRFLARRPGWQAKLDRVEARLRRGSTAFALGFRFLYGLRTVSPFALGMLEMAPVRFLVLNGIGAAIWAIAFGGAGYVFGRALDPVLDNFHAASKWVVLAAVGVIAVWLGWRLWRRAPPESPPPPPSPPSPPSAGPPAP